MNRWTLNAACAATALALAACGTTSSNQSATGNNRSAVGTPTQNAMPVSTNATLQAYHWYLDQAEDASGKPQPMFKALAPKTPVQLNFVAGEQPGDQRVSTKVCNTMMAGYALEGSQFKMGRVVSTMMACQDTKLSQLERAVGEQLGRMQSVQMVQGAPAPRMVVTFTDGSRWRMSGKPTDATRYGSAGETVFMEVGPHTQPCVSGEMRTQCLQVRELRYDGAGRKTVVSDWQNFHGSIDGFVYQPGVRNVLRLKRYAIQNPPADGASQAYVLDLRVETERVDRK